MREGMLWFDDDSKRDLSQKIGRAVKHYQAKFGRQPNVCYVHPSVAKDSKVQVGKVRVTPLQSVLQNHFWIGEERKK